VLAQPWFSSMLQTDRQAFQEAEERLNEAELRHATAMTEAVAQKEAAKESRRKLQEERARLEANREVASRKLASLLQQQSEAEEKAREAKRKKEELAREKRQVERQLATARSAVDVMIPMHWHHTNPSSSRAHFQDVTMELCDTMQRIIQIERPAHGRDTREGGAYSRLNAVRVWRVENSHLWTHYSTARRAMLQQAHSQARPTPTGPCGCGGCGGDRTKPTSTPAWERLGKASRGLPGPLTSEVNEVRLLHGTKPATVLNIADDGFNEHLNSAAAYGAGNYFAEDAAKTDQYVMPDSRFDHGCPLHRRLFSSGRPHPGQVYYVVVARVLLGHSHRVTQTLGSGVRDAHPRFGFDQSYHSLVAEPAARFREFISFHSRYTYPEYIVAYQRR